MNPRRTNYEHGEKVNVMSTEATVTNGLLTLGKKPNDKAEPQKGRKEEGKDYEKHTFEAVPQVHGQKMIEGRGDGKKNPFRTSRGRVEER